MPFATCLALLLTQAPAVPSRPPPPAAAQGTQSPANAPAGPKTSGTRAAKDGASAADPQGQAPTKGAAQAGSPVGSLKTLGAKRKTKEPPATTAEAPSTPAPAAPAGTVATPPASGSAPAPAPSPAPAPDPPPPPAPDEPLYSLEVIRQDAEAVILAFAKQGGINLVMMDRPSELITIAFVDLPFQEAFNKIVRAADLALQKVDGDYVVGSPLDMKVRFPAADEKDLDISYRCRHIGSESLVATLRNLFPPELKLSVGPLFLSPPLEGGGAISSQSDSIKPLSDTGPNFKTHDVAISGPAELVRRALVLARKFDRPRKQVRIAVKIVEVKNTADLQLGVKWQGTLDFKAQEQASPGPDGSSSATALVDGLRLGRFSHQPLLVSTTLNALESKGYVKTLSQPTLLLLDGERSFILSGDKFAYPSFKGRDDTGKAIYDVNEARIGIYLQVGVQVGLDNDMTLSIYPQITFRNGNVTFNGGDYPNIGTREEQTTVKAFHGEMIVLGGLLRTSKQDDHSGVPLLSRIPLLGALFKNRVKSDEKTELMMFLTPEIIEEPVPIPVIKLSVSDPAKAKS